MALKKINSMTLFWVGAMMAPPLTAGPISRETAKSPTKSSKNSTPPKPKSLSSKSPQAFEAGSTASRAKGAPGSSKLDRSAQAAPPPPLERNSQGLFSPSSEEINVFTIIQNILDRPWAKTTKGVHRAPDPQAHPLKILGQLRKNHALSSRENFRFFSQDNVERGSIKNIGDALNFACLQSTELRRANLAIKKAAEVVAECNGAFRPEVFLTANRTLNKVGALKDQEGRESEDPRNGPAKNNFGNLTLSAQQNLFNGFKTSHKAKKAFREFQASVYAEQSLEQSTFLKVIQHYIDLWEAILRCSIYVVYRDDLKQLSELVQARVAAGAATVEETGAALARLADAESQVLEAKGEIVRRRNDLEKLTGCLVDDHLQSFNLHQVIFTKPVADDQTYQRVLNQNPSFLSSKARLEAALLLPKIAAGEFSPRVDLSLEGKRSGSSSNYFLDESLDAAASNRNEVSANIQVRMPLDVQGHLASQYRTACLETTQARVELKETARELMSSIDHTIKAHEYAIKSYQSTRVAIYESEKAVQGVTLSYQMGNKTLYNVLQTQGDWILSHTRYIKALYDVARAYFQLLHLKGGLNRSNLQIPYAFNPHKYLGRVKYAPLTVSQVKEKNKVFGDHER